MFKIGRGVKWNGKMWVAVGIQNGVFKTPIAYSYDGICWKKPYKPISVNGFAVDWNGTLWVAGVDDSRTLICSYDGDTWFDSVSLPTNFECLTVVWNGTIWVAGGKDSNLLYSYDGLNWLNSYIITSPFSVYNTAAWNGSMWLIGGNKVPYIQYSYDGISWDIVNITNPPSDIINGITWDGNKWIAVGIGSTLPNVPIYYSYDGFDWSQTTVSTINFYGVAWNKNLGSTYIQQPVISLGVGNNPDKINTIAYSLDGIKYTGLGNFQNNLLNFGHAASWNGSMWVAVGESSITNTIIYSYDGIEWIPIPNSDTYIQTGFAVVWTGINWIVTGSTGNSGITYVCYSPDGINWLPSTTPSPTGVCYGLATDVITIPGGTQSTTVAVGDFGSPGIIYSQDDGLSWVQVGFPLPSFNLFCVAWNGTTWLAGGDAIPNQLYWSFDGINWNGAIQVTATNIRSIAWNGIVWVAVGTYDFSS